MKLSPVETILINQLEHLMSRIHCTCSRKQIVCDKCAARELIHSFKEVPAMEAL